MADDYDDDYFVPLVDQRVFGAGIKRKRVAFVPASNNVSSLPRTIGEARSAGDRYLSIVLNKTADGPDHIKDMIPTPVSANESNLSNCPICGQPISDVEEGDGSHATSIAHQVCLEHSHPPSHLDRSRSGLKYLQDYGWDPDARKGLGAQQEGIRVPIKAKRKNNTLGIGVQPRDDDEEVKVKQRKIQKPAEEEIVRLDAKAVIKMDREKKKRAERLRQSFYGDDFSSYLGSDG